MLTAEARPIGARMAGVRTCIDCGVALRRTKRYVNRGLARWPLRCPEHRAAAEVEKYRRYRERHPNRRQPLSEAQLVRQRERQRDRKRRLVRERWETEGRTVRVCEFCGITFRVQVKAGTPRKYCDRACCKAACIERNNGS